MSEQPEVLSIRPNTVPNTVGFYLVGWKLSTMLKTDYHSFGFRPWEGINAADVQDALMAASCYDRASGMHWVRVEARNAPWGQGDHLMGAGLHMMERDDYQPDAVVYGNANGLSVANCKCRPLKCACPLPTIPPELLGPDARYISFIQDSIRGRSPKYRLQVLPVHPTDLESQQACPPLMTAAEFLVTQLVR